MKTKKRYIAPEVSVDNFKMEKGCALSWKALMLLQDGGDEEFGDHNQENWNDGGQLGGNEWSWE